MALPVPDAGVTSGPLYATNITNCFTILDAHDHTAGSGVLITPLAMNINTTLAFNNNFATNVAGISLYAQGSTPASGTVYQSGIDLYWVNGNGAVVPITLGTSVNAGAGSITGLPSGTAGVSYDNVGKTYTFLSSTSHAANLDCATVSLRDINPNSTYAVSIQAPANLAASYNVVYPLTLPASSQPMSIDNSGNMSFGQITAAQITNATITTTQISASANIIGTQLSASAAILGSQLSASAGITGSQLAASTVTAAKMASSSITTGNGAIESSISLTGVPKVGTYPINVNNNGVNANYGMVSGYVTGNGNYSGFTVSIVDVYNPQRCVITLSSNFTANPAIVLTPLNSSASNITGLYAAPTTSSFQVYCDDGTGVFQPFSFIAMGQK